VSIAGIHRLACQRQTDLLGGLVAARLLSTHSIFPLGFVLFDVAHALKHASSPSPCIFISLNSYFLHSFIIGCWSASHNVRLFHQSRDTGSYSPPRLKQRGLHLQSYPYRHSITCTLTHAHLPFTEATLAYTCHLLSTSIDDIANRLLLGAVAGVPPARRSFSNAHPRRRWPPRPRILGLAMHLA
jgi:hypothetical protein